MDAQYGFFSAVTENDLLLNANTKLQFSLINLKPHSHPIIYAHLRVRKSKM